MPVFEIKLSDGRTVDVEADSAPNEEQLLSALSQHQEPPPDAMSFPSAQLSPVLGRQTIPERFHNQLPEALPSYPLQPASSNPQPIEMNQNPFSMLLEETSQAPVRLAKMVKNKAGDWVPEVGGVDISTGPELNPRSHTALALPLPTDYLAQFGPRGKVTDAVMGLNNAARNLINFFGSPQGAALAGLADLPPAMQKSAAGYFALDMAKHAPDALAAGDAALQRGDVAGAWENWGGGIANLVLAGLSGGHAISQGRPVPRGLENEFRDFERRLNEQPMDANTAAVVRSQLPPRATPETLPELVRTRDLVDQAIQEATQRIKTPGPSALDLLKARDPNIIPAGAAPEFRPGGGEAVGGKVSFMRPAEETSQGRTVTERITNAPLQREKPVVRQQEHTGANALREETISGSGNRPQESGQVTPEVNLDAALEARGYNELRRQKMTPEQKAAAAEQPIPSLEADAKTFWEIKDAMDNEPNVAKKFEMYNTFGEALELIKNRNTKSKGNPPERPKIAPPKEILDMEHPVEAAFQDENGKIWTGSSHVGVDMPSELREKSVMGFTTSKGRFVDYDRGLNLGQARYDALQEAGFDPNKYNKPEKPVSAETQGARGGEVVSDIVASPEPKTETPQTTGLSSKGEVSPESPPRVTPSETGALEAGAQSALDAVQKLKKKLEGGFHSGETALGLPKAAINMALEVIELGLKAGKPIARLIDEAIAKVKYNIEGFKHEKELRDYLKGELDRSGMGAVSDKVPPGKEPPSKSGIVSPEGQKPRSFSARATVSEKIPEPVQEQIKTDPRSSYTPQRVSEVESDVSKMTDAQLFALTPDSIRADYTLGKAELINRLKARGDNETVLDVVQEVSENLTRAGQIVNQAKFLNALKPEVQVSVIESGLKKAGKDPLTEKQKQVALETAKKAEEAKDVLKKAEDDWKNNPSKENEAKAEKALLDANLEALKMQVLHHRYQGRSIWKLLKAVLQGNLLTPMSQASNLFGNLAFLNARQGKRVIQTGMDIVQNSLFNKPRQVTVSPIRGTMAAWQGFARGVKQIPGILAHGTGNTILGEAGLGMHPFDAWVKQFSKEPDMPTVGGKITLGDRAKLLIEGTFGVPAEVMLRGLAAIDRPFREMAKARITENELKLAKVPVEKRRFAQKFPELFFDKKKLDQIREESDYAIFQSKSKPLGVLNRLLSEHDFIDFAASTVAPYKLTPWNLIGETMSYNPVIAFYQAVHKGFKGDRKGANEAAAKMVIGSAMTTAAYLLYDNGMLAPSLDSKDEQMKERLLAGEVLPPNHINVSALKRVAAKKAKFEKVTKEDTAFRKGDETKSILKFGLTGAFMYMTANIGRSMEKQPESGNWELAKQIALQSTLEQARFGMNQSFLSGVEGLLGAIQENRADSYWKQWASTAMSIPLPNTLSALSRATRTNKPDLSADTIEKKAENLVRNRLGVFGADEEFPLKRGLFGDPIPETPKGANPFSYHLFDVMKGQQVTDDPVMAEMYRLWRRYDNSQVIPTPPQAEVTHDNEKYLLNAKEHEELQMLVGKERKEIIDRIISEPDWHDLSDEDKIRLLKKVWDRGSDVGRAEFWDKHGTELEKKPKKAGFKL